jgi:hypothetical protein
MSRAVGIGRELKVVRLLRDAGWAAWTAKNDGVARWECPVCKWRTADKKVAEVHALTVCDPDDWPWKPENGQGPVDVIALKPGNPGQVIQVKSTARGPFHDFGPVKRQELIAEARAADLEAWLAWWPPGRGGCQWLHESTWPEARAVLSRSVRGNLPERVG